LGEKIRREGEKEEKWYCGGGKNVSVGFKKGTLLQF